MTTDPAAAGERIELLLEAMSSAGPVARERAEELVRVVVDLYGAGLERLLDLAHDTGALDDRLLQALAADDLVGSLLLVHGLHPLGPHERVLQALTAVDGARLLELTPDGVARVELTAEGCGAAAARAAVEEAVLAAAPEVTTVEVRTPQAVIGVDSLSARLRPLAAS